MTTSEQENDWLGVIARCLAFLCLAQADLRDKELAPQAAFLEGLGISRGEAATMLGTSADSLRVMLNRAKRQKGGRRGRKKGVKKGRKA